MKANIIALCTLCVFSVAGFAEQPTPLQPIPAKTATAVSPPPKIKLNTAEASSIAHAVKGIGIKRAEAIVKYREAHHGFKSLDELGQVPGIGKKFIERHSTELDTAFTISN